MKQHFRKSISLLLALLLCVGLFALPVSAEEAEGECGENLTWTLRNGVLTITGTGAMTDYSEFKVAPWDEYTQLVQRIVVQEGVTTVGNRAFYGMKNLINVSIPSSVKKLGSLAFADCFSMVQILMPQVEEIGWGCFYSCESLVNVKLPETLSFIGEKAFYRCLSLGGITIPAGVKEMGSLVFSHCAHLVYANIKAQLTVIPDWTFYGCLLLKEVHLPSSVQEIETNAFGECPKLNNVDYSGSQEVKDAIQEQLDQPITMSPKPGGSTEVSYKETENSSITVTTKTPAGGNASKDEEEYGTVIEATVNNDEGWEEVVAGVTKSVYTHQSPEVVIYIRPDQAINEEVLLQLSHMDLNVTIQTSDDFRWKIVMKDQTNASISGSQNFQTSMEKSNVSYDALGGARFISISLGHTSLNTTLQFPVGVELARHVATLYRVDRSELNKLSSVIIDDAGKASFCLAGTEEGDYVIAFDVPGIDKQEVFVPKALASEFDVIYGATLTDSQGNQYVLTGRVNKLGFGIGTLTLIVVGVLVGSMILVGIVMMLWNKQQKQKHAQYRRRE